MTSSSPIASSENALVFSLPVIKKINMDLSLQLTTENFLLWRTQVIPVLRCHNLLGFIDGSSPRPVSPPVEVEKWKYLDQLVLGWLLVSLSDAVLSQVVDQTTAYGAWQTLETIYGTCTRSRIQQLKTELHNLQRGSKMIHEYLQHAKSISLALANAGKPVDEDDLILCTLCGVGFDFDPIVAAIDSQQATPTFAFVSGMLLDFELRLKNAVPPQVFTAAASPSAPGRQPSPPSSRGSSSRRTSNSRGRSSNFSRGRGRSSLSSVAASSTDSLPVICYRCGLPNHKANHCWVQDSAAPSQWL